MGEQSEWETDVISRAKRERERERERETARVLISAPSRYGLRKIVNIIFNFIPSSLFFGFLLQTKAYHMKESLLSGVVTLSRLFVSSLVFSSGSVCSFSSPRLLSHLSLPSLLYLSLSSLLSCSPLPSPELAFLLYPSLSPSLLLILTLLLR